MEQIQISVFNGKKFRIIRCIIIIIKCISKINIENFETRGSFKLFLDRELIVVGEEMKRANLLSYRRTIRLFVLRVY